MALSMNPAQPAWLSASYYQHIPDNEVNWAALAQQWIAMKQTGPPQGDGEMKSEEGHPPLPNSTPQPPPQPPGAPPGPFPPGDANQAGGWKADDSSTGAAGNEVPSGPIGAGYDSMNSVGYPMGMRPPHMGPGYGMPPFHPGFHGGFRPQPPAGPPPPPEMFSGLDGFQPSAEEIAMRGPAVYTKEDYPPEGSYGYGDEPFMPADPNDPVYYNMGPNMGFHHQWRPPVYGGPGGWGRRRFDRSESNSPDGPALDMHAKKTLPAWIREGLEKMEREKRKQEEDAKAKEENDFPKHDPSKPRWESPERLSDQEEDTKSPARAQDELDDGSASERQNGDSGVSSDEEDEIELTEDELKQEALLTIRKWMTEILLSVTDKELQTICHDTHTRKLHKAPPKMLAQSSALAAISSLGEAEESSDSDEDGSKSSDESEDEETEERKGATRNGDRDEFKRPILPVVVSKRKGYNQSTSSPTQQDKPDRKESEESGPKTEGSKSSSSSRSSRGESSRWDVKASPSDEAKSPKRRKRSDSSSPEDRKSRKNVRDEKSDEDAKVTSKERHSKPQRDSEKRRSRSKERRRSRRSRSPEDKKREHKSSKSKSKKRTSRSRSKSPKSKKSLRTTRSKSRSSSPKSRKSRKISRSRSRSKSPKPRKSRKASRSKSRSPKSTRRSRSKSPKSRKRSRTPKSKRSREKHSRSKSRSPPRRKSRHSKKRSVSPSSGSSD